MNDADEVNSFGAHESIVWFFDNVTWSHVDQIPDNVLDDCLRDYDICGKATHVVLAGNFGQLGESEDPYLLQNWINRIRPLDKMPFLTFRNWIFLERARRLGLFKDSVPDVLVKEMVYLAKHEKFLKRHTDIVSMLHLRKSVYDTLKIKNPGGPE